MRKRIFIASFLYFLMCSPALSSAQNFRGDTLFRQKAINNLVSLYHQSIGHSSNLYNGTEYDLYPFPFETGHQFFNTASYTNGNVHYDDMLYSNVPLKYDIVRDALVLLRWDSIYTIQLIKDKIASFSLGEHHFIRIQDSLQEDAPKGFLEQLHAGKVSLLAKHTKTLQEIIDNRAVLLRTSYKRRLYLQKNEAYYLVKNKKDLFNLLKDRRSELTKFVKQQKINLKRNSSEGMTRIVAHYNELTN